MRPVVQEDRTGCAIACIAVLAGQSYPSVKREAVKLGIEVSDSKLWSETQHVRHLLTHFRLPAAAEETFKDWGALPDRALLAIKWHVEKTGPAWHWVVFIRAAAGEYVLDPKQSLRTHTRTDFGRMKPKWFIPLRDSRPRQL